MITVRFPSGFSLQYNDMHAIQQQADGSALLMKSEKSGWSVSVPAGALIEFSSPCRAYNPIAEQRDSDRRRIAQLESDLRDARRKLREARKGGK